MIETNWVEKKELFNRYVGNLPEDAVKTNLGCGDTNVEGFINADCYGDNYEVWCDLNKKPYPFEDSSVDFILCSHVLEHIKEQELFWFEMHRILKPEGIIFACVPHKDSKGAYCSFGHRGFFHEDCIYSITKDLNSDPTVKNQWILLDKIVSRGRFMKWQKREILWVVRKKIPDKIAKR